MKSTENNWHLYSSIELPLIVDSFTANYYLLVFTSSVLSVCKCVREGVDCLNHLTPSSCTAFQNHFRSISENAPFQNSSNFVPDQCP